MSRAFVIKGKNNQYKQENNGVEICNYYSNEIIYAEIFDDKEIASEFCSNDDKVVEVEIKEVEENE